MAVSQSSGVELIQESRDSHAIERVTTGVAAFVGRTLKGPVNQALSVGGFGEFQRHFGGLWQPSTVAYAVEQFFENGGRQALIVRIANGARPPTVTLPAGGAQLRLVALNPGSREYLRASVDYDGLNGAERDRFNLVVQRVRTAGSELVEDQEIYRRVSVLPACPRYVTDVLLQSRLVRVAEEVPGQRPDRTAGGPGGVAVGYTLSNPDGDDGAPLTDYDVIGAAGAHDVGMDRNDRMAGRGERFDHEAGGAFDGDRQVRRTADLPELAQQFAMQVKERQEECELDPLPAHERRIIHNALSDDTEIRTYSEGADPDRRVIIAPR